MTDDEVFGTGESVIDFPLDLGVPWGESKITSALALRFLSKRDAGTALKTFEAELVECKGGGERAGEFAPSVVGRKTNFNCNFPATVFVYQKKKQKGMNEKTQKEMN